MPLLETRGLSKRYEVPGGTTVEALASVDVVIEQGDFVVIVGHNGSGKSTLVSILGGELVGWAGEAMLEGKALGPRSERLALLKQDPSLNVALDLTVEENLCLADLGRKGRSRRPSPFRRFRGRAETAKEPGWGPDNALEPGQRVGTLSGGQRQLLAIRLALLQDPKVLLLDEPTASLDQDNASAVVSMLEKTWKQGMTIMMVTHDLAMARRLGNRLVVMRGGSIVGEYAGSERRDLTLEQLYERCGFGIGTADAERRDS